MNLSQPFIARPVGTSLLALGLFLIGLLAYLRLPVAPLPAFLSGWRVHFAPVLVQGSAALAGPPLEIVLR